MNDWRYLRYKPGAAHLWTPAPGRLWQTRCGRLNMRDLAVTTDPLERDQYLIPRCRVCVQYETRRRGVA